MLNTIKRYYNKARSGLFMGALFVVCLPLSVIDMASGSGPEAAMGNVALNALICIVFSPITLPLASPILSLRILFVPFDFLSWLYKQTIKNENVSLLAELI